MLVLFLVLLLVLLDLRVYLLEVKLVDGMTILIFLKNINKEKYFYFSYRKRNPRGDPIVCGVAVVLSVPFIIPVLLFSKDNLAVTWVCIFMAETLLCSNWALISDMLMVNI